MLPFLSISNEFWQKRKSFMKIFMNEGVIKEYDKCLIMFSKTFWAFYYKY